MRVRGISAREKGPRKDSPRQVGQEQAATTAMERELLAAEWLYVLSGIRLFL